MEKIALKVHDIVTLKKNLIDLLRNSIEIPAGTKGTILYVYDSGTAVDIEFVLNDKSFIETVAIDKLEL